MNSSSASFANNLKSVYARLRKGLAAEPRGYDWRIAQLNALKNMLTENDELFSEAMWKDLRKSKFECVATEQGIVLSEIKDSLRNLKSWMKPDRVHTPLYNLPGRCEIYRDPLGLTLIIGAWNYPINLLLAPLVGAIAGGNGAILKPSELAVNTAALLSKLIPQYLDQNLFAVVEAGPEETSILLDHVFDLIFFTGSGPIGKIVMTKAAQNLTPVVLELGGKSPAIVTSDADIEVTAKRITWGKFMNAGQTCVAPDYVFAHASIKNKLVQEINKTVLKFYGTDVQKSPDYCRIINAKNFDRLVGFLPSHESPGDTLLQGGKSDKQDLFIEPTIIGTHFESKVMKSEIFGPILPILEYTDLNEVVVKINSRPKPLALYMFTNDSAARDQVLAQTSAGGVCINDVVMHMPIPGFPFGGVGGSGMGHYHGVFSFKAFTHAKGVLKKATWLDVPLRYAPYTVKKAKWLRRLF